MYGHEYECSCFYVRVAHVRVGFFIVYLALLLYVDYATSKIFISQKKPRTEHNLLYILIYSMRVRAAALPAVQPWAKNKKRSKTKSRCGEPRLTDNRCARTSFGITTTQSLPSFLLGGGTVIACSNQPLTVSNRRGVSYTAPNAHTKMAPFSRLVSSTKLGLSWATDHESCRGFHLGY